MKLAEALILRADAKKRLIQIQERLKRSARVQEGDTPPENPQELLTELTRTVAEFTALMKRINRTNALTPFGNGQTLTDALADRDGLTTEQNVLATVIAEAALPAQRFAQSNIKIFRAVDVNASQKQLDALARRRRDLDTQIQALNWTVDLVE
jgi:hypothetical protein